MLLHLRWCSALLSWCPWHFYCFITNACETQCAQNCVFCQAVTCFNRAFQSQPCYDKQIFFFSIALSTLTGFLFRCSIVLYVPILFTLPCRHWHNPSFIHHFKSRTGGSWTSQEFEGQRQNKEGERAFVLFWGFFLEKKNWMENIKIRRGKKRTPSPFSFPLFQFFFSLPGGFGGFPVTWASGSPSLILSLVLYLFPFSTIFNLRHH